jgi:excisionase family DNA binding protein
MRTEKLEPSGYVSVNEVRDHLGVCRQSVINMLKDGLPYFRLRRQIRIPREAFEDYVQSRMVNGRKQPARAAAYSGRGKRASAK